MLPSTFLMFLIKKKITSSCVIPHWERWQKNNPHGLYHDNIILSWPQSQSPWWLSSSLFLDGHTLWHTHSASLVSSSLDYCWQHTALTSSPKHIASECDREVQIVSLFGWRNDSTHVTNVAQRSVSCFKVRHDEENYDWRSCRKISGPSEIQQTTATLREIIEDKSTCSFLGYAPKQRFGSQIVQEW